MYRKDLRVYRGVPSTLWQNGGLLMNTRNNIAGRAGGPRGSLRLGRVCAPGGGIDQPNDTEGTVQGPPTLRGSCLP